MLKKCQSSLYVHHELSRGHSIKELCTSIEASCQTLALYQLRVDGTHIKPQLVRTSSPARDPININYRLPLQIRNIDLVKYLPHSHHHEPTQRDARSVTKSSNFCNYHLNPDSDLNCLDDFESRSKLLSRTNLQSFQYFPFS